MMPFLLKKSKTKKKLFNGYESLGLIALVGLAFILVFVSQIITRPFEFGRIDVDIPVVQNYPVDKTLNFYEPVSSQAISSHTLAIVLAKDGGLYFGEMEAFASKFYLTNNKFVVRSNQGQPQVQKLLDTVEKWVDKREAEKNIKSDKIAVFVPDATIPMNIVIGIISDLKKSRLFDHVVIGNGLG